MWAQLLLCKGMFELLMQFLLVLLRCVECLYTQKCSICTVAQTHFIMHKHTNTNQFPARPCGQSFCNISHCENSADDHCVPLFASLSLLYFSQFAKLNCLFPLLLYFRLCLPYLLCQRVGPESPECIARAEDPARSKSHTRSAAHGAFVMKGCLFAASQEGISIFTMLMVHCLYAARAPVHFSSSLGSLFFLIITSPLSLNWLPPSSL